MKILECVPNISEANNIEVIARIAEGISSTDGVRLLHIDSGKAANRTVFTFAGYPEAVIESALKMYKLAYQLINMQNHHGHHPRIGAVDVCPLIPIQDITMEEAVIYSKKLAKRVADELNVPVFLYEKSACCEFRIQLSNIRRGGYESLPEKFKHFEWKPDYGPATFVPTFGATVIGARTFLIAYNINLDTESVEIANKIAYSIRESGYKNKPGKLKHVKAIGWYIEDFNKVQVSMNLTNYVETSLEDAFSSVVEEARKHNVSVTGSELIGLIPKQALISNNTLSSDKLADTTYEEALINDAVTRFGLSEISNFSPKQRIIEYLL